MSDDVLSEPMVLACPTGHLHSTTSRRMAEQAARGDLYCPKEVPGGQCSQPLAISQPSGGRTGGLVDLEDAGPHMASGQMRCRFTVLGGHVHCKMFGPFEGKAGDLVFRVSEWDHVRATHPQWQFIEEPS